MREYKIIWKGVEGVVAVPDQDIAHFEKILNYINKVNDDVKILEKGEGPSKERDWYLLEEVSVSGRLRATIGVEGTGNKLIAAIARWCNCVDVPYTVWLFFKQIAGISGM